MRVRDHVAVSTVSAALLHPLIGRGALGLWAGSVLIDADHYAWFCLRQRRWSPLAAVRFFNGAHPPEHGATRALHSPAALFAMLILCVRRPGLLPVAVGMGLHVTLDIQHEARMREARAAVLERDDYTCRDCGTRAPDVGTHLCQQPWLLPSYRTDNLVALCRHCHQSAHARRTGSWVSR